MADHRQGLGTQQADCADHQPDEVVNRCARRMIIENVMPLTSSTWMHSVSMRINGDVKLTVMASVLHRLTGARVGEGNEESRTIYRDLVRHSGTVTLAEDEILVRLRARSPLPPSCGAPAHPLLENKALRVQLSKRP